MCGPNFPSISGAQHVRLLTFEMGGMMLDKKQKKSNKKKEHEKSEALPPRIYLPELLDFKDNLFFFFSNLLFTLMNAEPDEWNGIVQKVMELDNSWNNTAGKYIEVYNSVRVRL